MSLVAVVRRDSSLQAVHGRRPIFLIDLKIDLILFSLVWFSVGCQPADRTGPRKDGTLKTSASGEITSDSSAPPIDLEKRAKPKPSVDRAQRLFDSGQRDSAWEETQRVLLIEPENPRAILIAAEVLAFRGKLRDAIRLVDQIGLDVPGVSVKAIHAAIDWHMQEGSLIEAERKIRLVQQKWPDDRQIDRKMVNLLQLQGRRWEASHYLRKIMDTGNASEFDLMSLVDLTQPLDARNEIQQLLSQPGHDLSVLLGLGFWELYENRMQEAKGIFARVSQVPNAPAMAWVGWGLVLSIDRDFNGLEDWYPQKPQGVEEFPEYWIVIGRWARDRGDTKSAIRCFWEALRRDSGHIEAMHQVALLLAADNQTDTAKKFHQRLANKQSIHQTLRRLSAGVREPVLLDRFAELLTELGYHGEAIAWRIYASKIQSATPVQLQSLEKERQKWIGVSSLPLSSDYAIDTQHYTLPDWLRDFATDKMRSGSGLASSSVAPHPTGDLKQKEAIFRFEDIAEQLGVQFTVDTGDDRSVPGSQIHQTNGCGLAVFDFDRDGWPDLFCNQSGGSPEIPRSSRPAALYRSRSGQKMQEVAEVAGAQNGYFGQGIAVGDIDQDGFPDLYVLNIGPNRIFLNQGDGTFREISCPMGKQSNEWSSSGAIADLNGDGIPDLIEINYAGGPEILSKKCPGNDGFPRACLPTQFPALDDSLWLGNGDGTFASTPTNWDLHIEGGRGLGVLVANFDDQYGNDVFISNDMTANHFLVSSPESSTLGSPDSKWMLRDEAGFRGNAVDAQGQPQACMGIAFGDVDRNGLMDMLVTNLDDEYNTLYLQTTAGLFMDATRRYQMVEPAMNKVGFGTQFADIDHDGWLDVLVLNGHVDDYSDQGKAYGMLPQIFAGNGQRYVELGGEKIGSYFTRPKVGRSLALWDVDLDGRLDFVGNHIDAPLSILRNESISNGNWIGLELVGTVSERDAIGAKVVVRSGEQRWVAVCTAGDGFQCSNQRVVHFGLGDVDRVDSIEVYWPSGRTQSLSNRSLNRYHLVVEDPTSLP